jgi:hypothetical protein
MPDTVTLTEDEINALVNELHFDGSLRFTNLANKRAVAKECKARRIPVMSRTAHGSLLDPRYTVEGRHIPDRGLANNYDQFQPKLYVLEKDRW